MAVSLAEGQSLVLQLREAGSVLGSTALALLQVENGAVIAATAIYNAHALTASPGLSSGLQLMRFLNNCRRFSTSQVRCAQIGRPVQHRCVCCVHGCARSHSSSICPKPDGWNLQVDALAAYLMDISPKERERYYTTLLRGRRRDTMELAGQDASASDHSLSSIFTL